MAELPEKLVVESSSAGIAGKAITLRIIERRRARKAATAAVHAKNELPKNYRLLLKLIRGHQLTDVKETATNLILGLHDGLQETHDVIIEEFLLLKEELLETVVFFQKYGSELSEEQIREYYKFLENNKTTLKQISEYVNGVVKAARGQSTPLFGEMDRKLEQYELGGVVNIVRPFFEWFEERSLAKKTFKIEGRIKKLEERRARTMADIHEILKLNKEFSQDFRKIITDMFIFTYILVKYGLRGAKTIEEQASPQYYNIPATYVKDFSKKIYDLLESEHYALSSIEKSVNYLYNLMGKAERSLEEALARAKRSGRELAKAA